MSLRERVLLLLGILGAIGLVVYPLAYRLSSVESTAGAEVVASLAPVPTSATASARPAGTPTATSSAPSSTPITDAWFTDAMAHRGQDGAEYDYECSPDGTFAQIWGTDIYTDDTSVCTAGVHAGVITREEGGTVTIIIRPGQAAYAGSLRHDVESQSYGAWQGSYEIVVP